MRYLAVGDIHGCFKALTTLAEFVPFYPHDVVITLGDYVDRGPHPLAVSNGSYPGNSATTLSPCAATMN